jgi:hypothetical protein
MHTLKRLEIVRGTLVALAVAGATGGLATPASAYVLYKTSSCAPGLKWDASRPVTVRLLADSVFDYLEKRGGTSTLTDLARIVDDIEAVIDLYNSVRGSSLVLDLGTGITGDSSLDSPEADDFGGQTIVIGFTNGVAASSSTAEAWATGDPDDGCTRTRAHVSFRKDYDWIFGPPDTTDVDGRAFYTAAQPKRPGGAQPRTFLGILTHEMGHALGLGHPDDNYAVMAQSFRTWFRGADHILHTRLLPDDTAGILALYGKTGVSKPLDVSVSNSWYKSAEAQFNSCTTQIAKVNQAAKAVSDATGVPVDAQFPAETIFKGEYVDLFQALASAQDALRACEDAKNAMQIDYCKVSSRGDQWTDRLKGDGVFCGVNNRTGSAHAPVSDRICPREQVQLRYTLNNHTSLRDVLVKSEAWFSRDTTLNAMDGTDSISPDVREFTLQAADSATVGQMFRLPADASSGQTLYVFVRAIPHDTKTGASLWNTDIAPWNNAIMLRHAITVDSAACR